MLSANPDPSAPSAWGVVEPLLDEVAQLMEQLVRETRCSVLGPILSEHLATGGKRLRARLALAAVAALDADPERGLGWAAVCELYHNATLIHDDLQDGDTKRRGHPTVWARHGAEQAINAGDLMILLAMAAVHQTDVPPATQLALHRVLARGAAAVICGQAEELALNEGPAADWTRYRQMVVGKTAGLFELPVEGAVLLAGRSEVEARALAQEFEALGVLFQLQDDVLDLYGDKGREAPGADIQEGKISGLVVEHLTLHPEDRGWLMGVLRAPRDRTAPGDVQRVIEQFRAGGALRAVCRLMDQLAEETRQSLVLAREPKLHELAQELTRVVLRPVQHVWD